MVPYWTNYDFCILESLEDSTYVQNVIQLVAFNKIDFDNNSLIRCAMIILNLWIGLSEK